MAQDLEIWARKSAKEGSNVNLQAAKQGLKLALSPLMVKKIRLETCRLMPTRTRNIQKYCILTKQSHVIRILSKRCFFRSETQTVSGPGEKAEPRAFFLTSLGFVLCWRIRARGLTSHAKRNKHHQSVLSTFEVQDFGTARTENLLEHSSFHVR